jgi:hypothetical protein
MTALDARGPRGGRAANPATENSNRREDMRMTVYDETTATVRALAAQARTTENVLFCEQRPLTSLEADFAGADRLASQLREIEDDAMRALQRLVDAEQGYETALKSIEEAGPDAADWLRAVMLTRSLDTPRPD